MDLDVALADFEGFFGFIVAIIIFISVFVGIVKKAQQSKGDMTHSSNDYPFSENPNGSGQLTNDQRKYQNELKQRKAQKQQNAPNNHNSHAHAGEVERYPEIVGSLGDVNDEGCAELDGIRLIVTDLMYEDGEEMEYDYSKIRKSIVLGEILNTPRFKNPYGKK